MDKPRVLLADDDNVVRSVLSSRLEGEFEIVGAAVDADEAVELSVAHDPDVVLLDVQMPGGGGVVAARAIRERAPRSAIVAISADESREGVLDMLDAGAMAYVRKDIATDELAKRLRAAIAAHRAAL